VSSSTIPSIACSRSTTSSKDFAADFRSHPAIESLAEWGPKLQEQIEEACFANYQDKLASVGLGTLPKIRQPSHVWKHMEVRSVRIDPTVPDRIVVYVVPEWDDDEHLEWCVEGVDKLVYVGQFLGYAVDRY
jgi:hypothetical protein